MQKSLVLSGLIICLAVLFGCSSKPSPLAGREVFEKELNSTGKARVVNFEKTNGKSMELMGVACYEMEFEAEIEFLEEVGIKESKVNLILSDVEQLSGLPVKSYSKGERKRIQGQISFEKTEKGWRGKLSAINIAFVGPKLLSKAKGLTCAKNMQKLYTELVIFEAEHRAYPTSKELLFSLFNQAGKKGASYFICPNVQYVPKEEELLDKYCLWSSYEVTSQELTNDLDADAPIIWDKKDNHNDGRNVLYWGGAIKLLSEEEFQQLVK